MNKCMFCYKNVPNPKAKFCNPAHKMAFRRGSKFENSTVTVIKETVTDNRNIPEITVTQTKTVTDWNKLKFTKDQPIKERIEVYKKMNPNCTFIPNWITHGFLTREDGIKEAMKFVEKSTGVKNWGLHTE